MSLNHHMHQNGRWVLANNIGSADNPVTFMIAPATASIDVDGTPYNLQSAHSFNGTLDGGSNTIHLAINDSRPNGVTGFIGHLGEFSGVSGITFLGSVQGTHIVGGVVGWNERANVTNNNISGLNVNRTAPSIVGNLVGVNDGGHIQNIPPSVQDVGITLPIGTSLALGSVLPLPELDEDDDGLMYPEEDAEGAEPENGDSANNLPDGTPDAKEPEDDTVDIKGPEDEDEPEDEEPDGPDDDDEEAFEERLRLWLEQ